MEEDGGNEILPHSTRPDESGLAGGQHDKLMCMPRANLFRVVGIRR